MFLYGCWWYGWYCWCCCFSCDLLIGCDWEWCLVVVVVFLVMCICSGLGLVCGRGSGCVGFCGWWWRCYVFVSLYWCWGLLWLVLCDVGVYVFVLLVYVVRMVWLCNCWCLVLGLVCGLFYCCGWLGRLLVVGLLVWVVCVVVGIFWNCLGWVGLCLVLLCWYFWFVGVVGFCYWVGSGWWYSFCCEVYKVWFWWWWFCFWWLGYG